MGALRPQAWSAIDTPDYILNWICEGVPLFFSSPPDSCCGVNMVLSPVHSQFVDAEIQTLLDRDSIREISERDAVCILPISVVPKKNGKLRLVLESRHINKWIVCPSFKQEGIQSVAAQIQAGDVLISYDIEHGFHHLKLRPDLRKFVCFQWKGQIYQWVSMPFGLKCAPFLFSKVMKQVVVHFQSLQFRCVVWVDNFIFMIRPQCVVNTRAQIESSFAALGWSVNWDKCDLVASTDTTFVGFQVFSVGDKGPWIRVPRKRIQKFRKLILTVLNHKSALIPVRTLARIAGRCVSMTKAVIPTKLLLRNVFRVMASKKDWNSLMQVDPPCHRDLMWWSSALWSWNGAPLLQPQVDLQVFTDASGSGWGGWSPQLPPHTDSCGPWEFQVAHQHSNYKELFGAFRALQSLEPHILHKSVQLVSDNVTTVAYLNHMTGKSIPAPRPHSVCLVPPARCVSSCQAPQRSTESEGRFLKSCPSTSQVAAAPRCVQIPGHSTGTSHRRSFCQREYSLALKIQRTLPRQILRGSRRLCSAVRGGGQEHNWINAPFNLLPRILQKLETDEASATVLAPCWKGASWYNKLLSMLVSPPVRLPQSLHLYVRRAGMPEPLKNLRWRIFAWRLSGKKGSGDLVGLSQWPRWQ